MTTTTEAEVARAVQEGFDRSMAEEDWFRGQHVRVQSFEERGVMTSSAGFVVRVGDREFQVTVVRSR